MAARGGADDRGEGGDEAARVGPAAGVRHVGRVVALGEQDERVADAQLGAPFVEGHAELVVQEAAQRTGRRLRSAGRAPPVGCCRPEMGREFDGGYAEYALLPN